tara:strand:+ start:116 stop:304 length:189 start_codon:yes stop_codon:yes gene_type:complete
MGCGEGKIFAGCVLVATDLGSVSDESTLNIIPRTLLGWKDIKWFTFITFKSDDITRLRTFWW